MKRYCSFCGKRQQDVRFLITGSGNLAACDECTDLLTATAKGYRKGLDYMTEDHKPLPVAGYTPQPDAKVALVNEFKLDEERLLRKLDALTIPSNQKWGDVGADLTSLSTKGDVDQRWLSVGRRHLQQAFMEINRAVFQPTRIRLPEDEA